MAASGVLLRDVGERSGLGRGSFDTLRDGGETVKEIGHDTLVGNDKVVELEHLFLLVSKLLFVGEVLEDLSDENEELPLCGCGELLDESIRLGCGDAGDDEAEEKEATHGNRVLLLSVLLQETPCGLRVGVEGTLEVVAGVDHLVQAVCQLENGVVKHVPM